MTPADSADVGGVLDLLADDAWRDAHKRDLLYYDHYSELPVWGVLESRCYVTFVEYEDGRVGVATVNRTSMMRPPSWAPWF